MKSIRPAIRATGLTARFTSLLPVSVVLAVFSLPFGAAYTQDFNSGLDAYKRKQFDSARAEFNPLAEAGQAKAQYYMGAIFGLGLGVERDTDKAEAWFAKAAEQGHAQAQYSLGRLHLQRSEIDGAIKYFKRAAAQGVRSAQYNLGVIYAKGDGVSKNFEEAINWYALAGANGHPNAQFNLGVFYRDGLGTVANGSKAVEWLTRSAKNGNVLAQINLARIFALGKVVPKDLVRSYMWLEITQPRPNRRRSSYNRQDSARFSKVMSSAVAAKTLLEEQMSPADIGRAKKRAGDWISEFGTAAN